MLFYLGPFEIVRTLKSRFLVVDGIEFILVAFGIESLDFENLRNVSSSWPAFELNDDVERVADVGLDSAIRQFNAALQNAAREP